MPILRIHTYPDPILKLRAKPVVEVDEDVRRLMDDMATTMYLAAGVGLAAPQVGVSVRVIVVDVSAERDGSGTFFLANPVILWADGQNDMEEGCLSVPDFAATVRRAARVTVEGLDRDGARKVIEAEGMLARALQHEMDHLDGVLIVDRLRGLKGDMARKRLSKRTAGDTL